MNSIFMIMLSVLTLCASRNPFPDRTDNNFLQDCVRAHNSYRAKHGSPPLILDNRTIAYSKTRCNTVSRFEVLSEAHKGLIGYGENLSWRGDPNNTTNPCSAAVKRWYDEIKLYRFNNPGFSLKTGHFTGVVWKSTRGVGCARCADKGSQWFETYVVCNYSPAGNMEGAFPKNVSPLRN